MWGEGTWLENKGYNPLCLLETVILITFNSHSFCMLLDPLIGLKAYW